MFGNSSRTARVVLSVCLLLAACVSPASPNPSASGSLTGLIPSATSVSLVLGVSTTMLSLKGSYSDGTTATVSDAVWTSDNALVATVAAGQVTPVGTGSTTVTATKTGQSTTVSVTVRAAIPLPDTGQTATFPTATTGSTVGEDADFTTDSPSLTVNGDGTVTDNVTGLMWEQNDGGEMTFPNAQAYVATLNSSKSLGGYSDWRLPTSNELFGINNFQTINPALDATAFPYSYAAEATALSLSVTDYIRELYWWSGDVLASDSTRVWVTNAGGGIGPHGTSETVSANAGGTRYMHVRAVRRPTSLVLPATRFTDNGNATVTDNYTGLQWQKIQSSGTYTWEAALAYVTAMNASGGFAGRTDWRLPNIRELFSLVDVSLTNPCLNTAYFTNAAAISSLSNTIPTNPGVLWSSTTMINNSSLAWDLHDLYYGIISYSDKTSASEYVLCVRGGL